jgi:hypothetical protein
MDELVGERHAMLAHMPKPPAKLLKIAFATEPV